MMLIGKPLRFKISKPLLIPPFQRIGLGLETGTRVFLVAMPPKNDRVDEIIVSTLEPRNWNQLVRITARLKERPGVVASVLAVLKHNHININIFETLTTAAEDTHELLAIVTLAPDAIPGLLDVLQDTLLKAEAITERRAVTIACLHRLADASDRLPPGVGTSVLTTEMKDGEINISEDEWLRLFSCNEQRPARSAYATVVMYSDTEEKYLSLYFPAPEACLLRMAVKHFDRPGAAFAFTSQFESMGVNIINTYSRLQQSGEYAEWHATLDVSKAKSCAAVVKAVQEQDKYFHGLLDIRLRYNEVDRPPDMVTPPLFSYDVALDKEERFFGREAELDQVVTVARNTLLNGFSKAGKSSLLMKLRNVLPKAGCLVVSFVADSDPLLFVATAIQNIWRRLEERYSDIGDPPGCLVPYLPVPEFSIPGKSHSMLRGPNGMSIGSASKDDSEEVVLAFRQLANYVKSKGFTRLVMLVDEFQEILYSKSEDGGAELRHVLTRILEGVPREELQWIFCDSRYWKNPRTKENSSVLAKMHVVDLGPLSEAAARRFVSESFAEVGISVLASTATRILTLAGHHPYCLSVVCHSLRRELSRAPSMVDILIDEVVEAKPTRTQYLRDLDVFCRAVHFELERLLGPDGAGELMSGNWKSRDSPQCRKGDLRFQADVIPGMTLNDGRIGPIPLFREWYSQGVWSRH
jgi:hypothetical protein